MKNDRTRSQLRVLGIMSGTSLDGVDCALCRVGTDGVKLLKLWSCNFPKALHRRLQLAARGEANSWELAQLHHDLGRFYATAARRGEHVCVHNLGGISNVTSLDWRRGAQPRVLAFDTGPANVLLDLAMRHFTDGRETCDQSGLFALQGKVCEPLLKKWLKHPFFRQAPPKSTGRELFGEKFLQPALAEMQRLRLAPQDFVVTLTEFTARSLALNYRLHLPAPPDRVVLAGGGAANPALCNAIQREIKVLNPHVIVTLSQQHGWPAKSIEPAAFALLAWRRWFDLPGNLPATTGARRAVLCGQITAA